jgi:hypothetical protein
MQRQEAEKRRVHEASTRPPAASAVAPPPSYIEAYAVAPRRFAAPLAEAPGCDAPPVEDQPQVQPTAAEEVPVAAAPVESFPATPTVAGDGSNRLPTRQESTSSQPRTFDSMYRSFLNEGGDPQDHIPSPLEAFQRALSQPSQRQLYLQGLAARHHGVQACEAPALQRPADAAAPSAMPTVYSACPTAPASLAELPAADEAALLPIAINPDLIHSFLQASAASSALNQETCGILAGRKQSGRFEITAILLPSQGGDADSCQPTEAGESSLFAFQVFESGARRWWLQPAPSVPTRPSPPQVCGFPPFTRWWWVG